MDATVVAVATLGLVLGLRHAFDPDHLAAVSTLATRHGRLRDGARLGLAWGLGHAAMVAAVALAVGAAGLRLPAAFSAAAELIVALLLILLGLPVVVRYARGRWHMHLHAHDGVTHLHLHSHATGPSHAHTHTAWDARRALGLGLAHGMAGSAAIVVLLAATAATRSAQVAYVVAFGVGSTLGMLAVTVALAGVVRWVARGGERLAGGLHVAAALASVFVGIALAIQVLGG
jgi:ABC-type nickel/cobalt efflux system permease component RcnA